jgi:hypothetical protein
MGESLFSIRRELREHRNDIGLYGGSAAGEDQRRNSNGIPDAAN